MGGIFGGASDYVSARAPQLPTISTGPVPWNPQGAVLGSMLPVGGIAGGILGGTPIGKGIAGDLFGTTSQAFQNYGSGPRPDMPDFKSILDADGNLSSKYKYNVPALVNNQTLRGAPLNVTSNLANQDALAALKGRALNTNNQFYSNEMDKIGMDERALQGRIPSQVMGQVASGQSQLAMKGGLTSGASERLLKSANKNALLSQQQVGADAARRRLDLGIADDQMRTGLLSQVPGMDLNFANQKSDLEKFNVMNELDKQKYEATSAQNANAANVQLQSDAARANAQNAISGIGGENAFNLGKYNEQMRGYAAGMQANALGNGGKK